MAGWCRQVEVIFTVGSVDGGKRERAKATLYVQSFASPPTTTIELVPLNVLSWLIPASGYSQSDSLHSFPSCKVRSLLFAGKRISNNIISFEILWTDDFGQFDLTCVFVNLLTVATWLKLRIFFSSTARNSSRQPKVNCERAEHKINQSSGKNYGSSSSDTGRQ